MYLMCLKNRRQQRHFEVKTTAILNRADLCTYQYYRAHNSQGTDKKKKIGQCKQNGIIKT